jgi:hypothetical protein
LSLPTPLTLTEQVLGLDTLLRTPGEEDLDLLELEGVGVGGAAAVRAGSMERSAAVCTCGDFRYDSSIGSCSDARCIEACTGATVWCQA